MNAKERVDIALRLMPKDLPEAPAGEAAREEMRKTWSNAVRAGRVIELPDLYEDTVGTYIQHRDIGRDLAAERIIDDPFAPHPWIVIHRVTNTDHHGRHEYRAFIYRKVTEGEHENKVLFISLSIPEDMRTYVYVTHGIFDFHEPDGNIVINPDTPKNMRAIEVPEYRIKDVVNMLANQAWGTYSTVLGFLNTRGIRYKTSESKIDKRGNLRSVGRIVPQNLYVTHISEQGEIAGGTGKVGTHASPRPHIRRGHVRSLPSGGVTWVRPHMVNVVSEGELAFLERSRYKVR